MMNQHDWSKGSQYKEPEKYKPPGNPSVKLPEDEKPKSEREQLVETDMLGFVKFVTRETWRKAETVNTYTWTGPRVPIDKWREVQAFFRWVNKEHKSEAVCRVYLNNTLNTWAFWAYPQEIKPGMEALELDGGEARQEQRAQFKPSEGWEPFGSIHSHCNAGAFQSSTDKSDEESSIGIHITLGKVGEKRMDMHWRLSLEGHSYDLKDITTIWPILPEVANLDLPEDMICRLAEYSACRAPDENQSFPEKWRENLIPKPVLPVVQHQQGTYTTADGKIYVPTNDTYKGSLSQYYGGAAKDGTGSHGRSIKYKAHGDILNELIAMSQAYGMTIEDMDTVMGKIEAGHIWAEIIDFASDNALTSQEILEAWTITPPETEEKKGDSDLTGGDHFGYTYGID